MKIQGHQDNSFDLFKIDNKIQEKVKESITPILQEQIKTLKTQQDIQHQQQLLRKQLRDSVDELQRAMNLINQFKRFDFDLLQLKKGVQELKDSYNREYDRNSKLFDQLYQQTKTIELDLEKTESRVKIIDKDRKMQLKDVGSLMENYKTDLQNYMLNMSMDINKSLRKYDETYYQLSCDTKLIIKKYTQWDDHIQKTQYSVAGLEAKMADMQETFSSLKAIKTYDKRLVQMENQVRQTNMMTQRLTIDTQQTLSKAMYNRDTEETIIKYLFSMMDNVFGREHLGNEQEKKLDIQSQLKINFSKWKADIKEQFDLGIHTDEPERFALFQFVPLKKAGELRKKALEYDLEAQKYSTKPKHDDWGFIRRNSLDNKKVPRMSKRILESPNTPAKDIQNPDLPNFGVLHPRAMKDQAFSLPKLPQQYARQKSTIVTLRNNEPLFKTYEQIQKDKKEEEERKKEEEILAKLQEQQAKERQEMKDQRTRRRNKNEGRAGATPLGRVSRRHSQFMSERSSDAGEHGDKSPLKVQRRTSKIIHGNSIKGNSKGNISSIQEISESSSDGREKMKKPQSVGVNQLEPNTQEIKSMSVVIQQPQNASMRDVLVQQKTHFSDAKRKSQTSVGSGGRKSTPKDTTKELEDSRSQSPSESESGGQVKEVIVQKGMSPEEMDEFKDEMFEEFMEEVDEKIAEEHDKIDGEVEEKIDILNEVLEETEKTLNEKIEKAQEEAKEQLSSRMENIGERLRELRDYADKNFIKQSDDFNQQFQQQMKVNEEVQNQFKALQRKVNGNQTKNELTFQTIKIKQTEIVEKHEQLMTEFNSVVEVVISMVENSFLANLLDIQEEVDKYKTSLWAINETQATAGQKFKKEIEDAIKPPKDKDYPLQVDEDCFTCSLKKHKPVIKEAFKMACVQYKPSNIPFRGSEFQRKSLLEFRESILTSTWNMALTKISFLKEQYGEKNINNTYDFKEEFLNRLLSKLEYMKVKQEMQNNILKIDKMILDHDLNEHISKNESNLSFVFDTTNDMQRLKNFESKVIIRHKGTQSTNAVNRSVQDLDKRTQSVIEKLKSQTKKNSRRYSQTEESLLASNEEVNVKKNDISNDSLPKKQNARRRDRNMRMLTDSHQGIQKISHTNSQQPLKPFGKSHSHFLHIHSFIPSVSQKNIVKNQIVVKQANAGNNVPNFNFGFVSDSKFRRHPNTNNPSDNFSVIEEAHTNPIIDSEDQRSHFDNSDIILNDSSLPQILIVKDNNSTTPQQKGIFKNKDTKGKTVSSLHSGEYNQSQLTGKKLQFEVEEKTRLPEVIIRDESQTFNQNYALEQDMSQKSLSKVLTVLSASKKQELLQVVKQHNRETKRLDNYTVVKGSTKNLSLKMSSERLTSNNSDLGDALRVQASLQKNSVRGNGYLYSHDLIENLRSPFKNPFKSPLSEIDKIYNTNREAVTQMSDMLALITLKGQNKHAKDKKIDSIKVNKQKVRGDTEQSPSNNSYSEKYNQNAHTSHATLIRQGNDSSIVIEENNQNANTVIVDQNDQPLRKRESSSTKSRRSFIMSKNKNGSIFGYTGPANELPPGLQEFREVQQHINMMRKIKKEEQEDSDSVYQYKEKSPIVFNDTSKQGQWKDIPSQEIQVNISVENKNEQSEKKKKKSSTNDKGSKQQNPSQTDYSGSKIGSNRILNNTQRSRPQNMAEPPDLLVRGESTFPEGGPFQNNNKSLNNSFKQITQGDKFKTQNKVSIATQGFDLPWEDTSPMQSPAEEGSSLK